MEQQSTLCNLASVATHEGDQLISLNFDSSSTKKAGNPGGHIITSKVLELEYKVRELTQENQGLQNTIMELRHKHRAEKQGLVERLQ
jgi:hypothetical protein